MATKARNMVFGKKLAELRKGRHMTQQELGDALGMTRHLIAYYEKATNPTAEVICTFAEFFGVSVDELLYDRANGSHPGPAGRLEQQFEELRQLPKSKQKTVSDMLEGMLVAERRA